MTLIECRHALLHHLLSGACADYDVNVTRSPRPQRATCRSISQDFLSASDISQHALHIILSADHKQMPTEHLSHIAAVLNFSVPGKRNLLFRNLLFKLRVGIIRKVMNDVSSSDMESRSSASVSTLLNHRGYPFVQRQRTQQNSTVSTVSDL
jgi:hypothetical protein